VLAPRSARRTRPVDLRLRSARGRTSKQGYLVLETVPAVAPKSRAGCRHQFTEK